MTSSFMQANTNLEAYRAQLAGFMAVVEERRHLPALKQFLKLYSVGGAGRGGAGRGGAGRGGAGQQLTIHALQCNEKQWRSLMSSTLSAFH